MYSNLRKICREGSSNVLMSNQKFNLPVEQPIIEKSVNMCSATGSCKNDWKKDPTLWGPHLWYYLHYSAANYPSNPNKQEIEAMKNWLCSLPVTIPCENCSKHYNAYINKNKSKLDDICSDKQKLFNFLVDIHNKVNQRNGKPEMSYEDAWNMYK